MHSHSDEALAKLEGVRVQWRSRSEVTLMHMSNPTIAQNAAEKSSHPFVHVYTHSLVNAHAQVTALSLPKRQKTCHSVARAHSSAVAQPMGLRSILRQLENYGGQLALQAEHAAR
eukprot:1159169-Pelagomonas_calceolata.AAC.2